MEGIQKNTRAIVVSRRTQTVGPMLIGVAVAAVALSVVIAWTLTAGSQAVVGIQGDPLVQPAAVEFRSSERGASQSLVDPLLRPASIEFRASERGASQSLVDPLLKPAAIEFRASEHSPSVSQADPLLQPRAIEFRVSEHAAGASR
jgi:hypothetical protein